MSEQEQMARIRRFIRLTRRALAVQLDEAELAEYEETGRELSTLPGDALLRLMVDPLNAGSIIYTLRS